MASRYDEAMGFRSIDVGPGHAVCEAEVGEHLHNPTGRLHGGILAGLADTAMGEAFLAYGHTGTNTDLDIRFLRPVLSGRLRATARTIKAGRRITVMACEVHDAEGRLVATAQSQFMRL